MLSKIVWFWNLVHYNFFVWEKKITSFVLYPFLKILRNNKVVNFYNKRGVNNPDELVKDALLNPSYGTNSLKSFSFMGILLIFMLFGLIFIFNGIFKKTVSLDIINLLIVTALAYFINYYLLSHNGKYILFFNEFNAMSKNTKVKYGWISFAFILLVASFLVASFMIMDWLLHNS
jgi:hypothetical protein